MSSSESLALAAIIIGAMWTLVQIGDRLWWNKDKSGSDSKLADNRRLCNYEHTSITAALTRLADSQAELSRAVTQLIADRRAEHEIASERHKALLDAIRAESNK